MNNGVDNTLKRYALTGSEREKEKEKAVRSGEAMKVGIVVTNNTRGRNPTWREVADFNIRGYFSIAQSNEKFTALTRYIVDMVPRPVKLSGRRLGEVVH